MKITTLIPTYRRPKDLARCLKGLREQTRQADEILVIVRNTDSETWALINNLDTSYLPLYSVRVNTPGQVFALNSGLESATGDIIAITDDDTVPHVDWLEKIEKYFLADDSLGGLGGRDWVYKDNQFLNGSCKRVGQISWFGRVTGNHHLGVGKAREVEILKGANMSFRHSAISQLRFDKRLRGSGAQVCNDLAFCLTLRKKGWKLLYAPEVEVDHYVAQRFDEDKRNNFNYKAFRNAVHNETLVLLEYFSPVKKCVFFLWAILVGTRRAMGFVQWVRFLPSQGTMANQKFIASLSGRIQGYLTWQKSNI